VLYVGLAGIAATVVLAGASAYFVGLFSERGVSAEGVAADIDGGFWDSLLWSLKHVIDPGAFAEDYGAPAPVLVIALIISLLGLAIFGTLVGFITSLVQRRIERLERGDSPVVEQGHTLVLGWNRYAPAVLRGLGDLGPRTVVLLAPREHARMADALRAEGLGSRDLDVVLRSGSPSRIAELRTVAFEHAASIIVLGSEGEGSQSIDPDVEVIKTLLVLASFRDWPNERPRMVGEIEHKPNYEIARIASRGSVPLVSSAEVVSRLLVQTARYGGLSRVYSRLFSAEGGAFHVRHLPGCTGRRFGDLACELAGAVPIGVTWNVGEGTERRSAVALNPEPDYELDEGESLVLLSPGADFVQGRVQPSIELASAPPPPAVPAPQFSTVLILGWSRIVDEILAELDAHAQQEVTVRILADVEVAEMQARVDESFDPPLAHVRLECERANPVRRGTFEAIDPTDADCIFVLADEARPGEDPDAGTILTLLLLRDRLERARGAQRPRVVAELREARNRELLEDSVADDVVVSPEVVSVLLTQISQVPVLGPVYRELLSAGGIEICLRRAGRYAPIGEPCRFRELIGAGQRALEIVLGVVIRPSAGESGPPRIELAPDADSTWTLRESDQVIVLAQQVYS